jgi:hypothetical protein
MVLHYGEGSQTGKISDEQLKNCIYSVLKKLEEEKGSKFKNVAIVPPDFTRFHS